jgi:hypothetical protein
MPKGFIAFIKEQRNKTDKGGKKDREFKETKRGVDL